MSIICRAVGRCHCWPRRPKTAIPAPVPLTLAGQFGRDSEDEVNLVPVRDARKPRHAVVGAGERAVGQRLDGALEVGGADDVEAVIL